MAEGLTDAQMIERLQRLERNLAKVAEHIGVELEVAGAGVDPDIAELARSGDRMGAAKLYAERTGSSFVDAQRAVSAL